MFWLISVLVTAGAGGMAIVAAMNRLAGEGQRIFRGARELSPESFAEGLHGRLSGVAELVPGSEPLATPGQGTPCLIYELIVYELNTQHDTGTTHSRIVHRGRAGGEIDVVVAGTTRVRVDCRDIQLVEAPSFDLGRDLREVPGYGTYTSHVRFVAPGATVQLVGTLAREVDADPGAQQDYREVATRYRLIRTRAQPIVLATKR
jgi:hypothetical protein